MSIVVFLYLKNENILNTLQGYTIYLLRATLCLLFLLEKCILL